jgi:hypothetical protein
MKEIEGNLQMKKTISQVSQKRLNLTEYSSCSEDLDVQITKDIHVTFSCGNLMTKYHKTDEQVGTDDKFITSVETMKILELGSPN